MQQQSRWTGIGVAIAIGLLVVLLLPVGSLSRLIDSGPSGGPADSRSPELLSTLRHWVDRVMDIDLTGPRGIFADSSGFNLVLLAGIAVLLLLFAPRLVLLALALIVGLPLLLDLISVLIPGLEPGAPGPGGRAPWERLFEPGLFGRSLEPILLLGILVVIGIALMQRSQSRERVTDGRDTRADDQ